MNNDHPKEPAWIGQSRDLFWLLREQSKPNEYGQQIWQGKLLGLYHEVGASNASYTRIMRLLTTYGVIRYVQRGNRHQPTVIEITGELPRGDLIPPEHLTEARSAATLVAEVERQTKSLQAWRESLERGGLDLARVVQDFELRLTRLEREVRRIGSVKDKAK